MLVKKFEAPSMKEALNMVKTHLGPDAVILSARENTSAFGLVGKGSIEVTAAVSETQLKKKQVAESRISPNDRERLLNSTARRQKEFIDKSVSRFAPPAPKEAPQAKSQQPAIGRRYIDIPDEQPQAAPPSSRTVFTSQVAAQAALPNKDFVAAPERSRIQSLVAENRHQESEILSLKSEVNQLRTLLESFKKTPPHLMSLHPGADHGLPYEVSALYQRLTESGISVELSTQICKRALNEMTHEQIKKKSLVDAWAAKHILGEVRLSPEASSPGFHLFVGPSGQGKTSSLVKMASHMVLHERKSVAILTTDTRRVGAVDQLRIYSQILNVPFGVIRTKADWEAVIPSLRGVECVLVDYPGLSLKSIEEIDLLQSLMPPAEVKRHIHLVLSVNQKDADAAEMARRYRLAHYGDFVFTKLDESAHHGLIFNLQTEFHTPLHSLGVGAMIPEDFEWATKERVVDLIFKISNLKGN